MSRNEVLAGFEKNLTHLGKRNKPYIPSLKQFLHLRESQKNEIHPNNQLELPNEIQHRCTTEQQAQKRE